MAFSDKQNCLTQCERLFCYLGHRRLGCSGLLFRSLPGFGDDSSRLATDPNLRNTDGSSLYP